MSDDLVERVARAIAEAYVAAVSHGQLTLADSEYHWSDWRLEARAAIAVVLEEAAKVAENYDGPGMESVPDATWGDAQATKDDIAYYIRALVKEPT